MTSRHDSRGGSWENLARHERHAYVRMKRTFELPLLFAHQIREVASKLVGKQVLSVQKTIR